MENGKKVNLSKQNLYGIQFQLNQHIYFFFFVLDYFFTDTVVVI